MANEFVVRKGLTILTVPTGTTETDILLKDANGNVVTRTLSALGGVSGYSGKSGYSGATGVSGYSGISGDRGGTGNSGYSGKSGYSGAPGAQGTSGYSGNADPFWAYHSAQTYLYPNPDNVASDSDVILTGGRLLVHSSYVPSNDFTDISANNITAYGKTDIPEINLWRYGSGSGNYPDANTVLGFINFTGASPSNAGVEIYATVSEHVWSNTNTGALFNIRTCPDNEITIWSRFMVDTSGWVWINWDKAATKFTVKGDTDDYLFSVDGINQRVSVAADTTYCKFTVESEDGTGHSVMDLVQNDLDKGFIWYHGSASNDALHNISTYTGSGASVVGPKGYVAGVSDGWKYEGMVKIEVNAGEYWTPYYSYQSVS